MAVPGNTKRPTFYNTMLRDSDQLNTHEYILKWPNQLQCDVQLDALDKTIPNLMNSETTCGKLLTILHFGPGTCKNLIL
jgi:hypothetical protein